MERQEEIQEQLNKITKYRIGADEKERELKAEMANILMDKYIGGFMAIKRNHGEISKRDFEVMMKGFAKEVVQLYTGSKPW